MYGIVDQSWYELPFACRTWKTTPPHSFVGQIILKIKKKIILHTTTQDQPMEPTFFPIFKTMCMTFYDFVRRHPGFTTMPLCAPLFSQLCMMYDYGKVDGCTSYQNELRRSAKKVEKDTKKNFNDVKI
jgi:hypothetical protein